jgi:hypothetical protein
MNAVDQLNALEAKIETVGDKLDSDPTNQALINEMIEFLAVHGTILGRALRTEPARTRGRQARRRTQPQ